jgi:alpha-1,2-glucosyltransferase
MTPTPRETWMLGIALGVLYAVAIAASMHGAARSDEIYHFSQIELFRHGELRVLDKYLTTIPGYHAAVAAALAATGLDSLGAARAVTALFGLLAVAAFHAIRRDTQRGTETLATAQFIVLPVLAPFFFLVYTDTLALALILWAAFATLRARHVASALLLSAAVLVRQSDVIWAGFLVLVVLWPAIRARNRVDIQHAVVRALPYVGPVVVFAAFWIGNGSISLSREQAALHPEFSFHVGNALAGLVLAGVLLPLQALAGTADFRARFVGTPWLFAIPLVTFFSIPFFFVADHPYNAAQTDFFLHNRLAELMASDAWRYAAGMFAALAVCGLASTRLVPAAAVWLYPISAFFLCAEWLIETRYLIVPFALWLAFRQHRHRVIEWTTLALWAAVAVSIIAGTLSGRIFP